MPLGHSSHQPDKVGDGPRSREGEGCFADGKDASISEKVYCTLSLNNVNCSNGTAGVTVPLEPPDRAVALILLK